MVGGNREGAILKPFDYELPALTMSCLVWPIMAEVAQGSLVPLDRCSDGARERERGRVANSKHYGGRELREGAQGVRERGRECEKIREEEGTGSRREVGSEIKRK